MRWRKVEVGAVLKYVGWYMLVSEGGDNFTLFPDNPSPLIKRVAFHPLN